MAKKKILIHILSIESLGHIRLGEIIVQELFNRMPESEFILVSEDDIRPLLKNVGSVDCEFIKLKHKKIIKNNRDESSANNGGNLYQYHTNLDEIILKKRPDIVVFLALFPRQVLERIKNLHNKNVLITWAYRKEQWEIFLNNNYNKYFDAIYLIDLEKPKIAYQKNVHYVGPITPCLNLKSTVSKYIIKKYKLDRNKFIVLITAGGGGFASAENVLNNLNQITDKYHDKVRFIIISGPFFRQFKHLSKQQKENVIIEKYEPHILELMPYCDLIISEAGYNMVNEIILTKTPAILVPGYRNNDDQYERALFLHKKTGIEVIKTISEAPKLILKYLKNRKKLSRIKKKLFEIQLLNGNKIFRNY